MQDRRWEARRGSQEQGGDGGQRTAEPAELCWLQVPLNFKGEANGQKLKSGLI